MAFFEREREIYTLTRAQNPNLGMCPDRIELAAFGAQNGAQSSGHTPRASLPLNTNVPGNHIPADLGEEDGCGEADS